MSKEFTYSEVSEHSSKKDLYVVIHDKVYNACTFVDEHPGGEEVLLDVAGVDATEAFEDVGHSDEAREILDGLKVGTLKRQPGDPKPKGNPAGVVAGGSPAGNAQSSGAGGFGLGLYVLLLGGGLLAYGAYVYLEGEKAKSK